MRGDERHVAERLDVVDDGRHAVQAGLRRERRARGDGPAQALKACEQRGLLADDVGAGALDHGDVEGEARPADVLAEPAVGAGSSGRRLQRRLRQRVLRAHEHEAMRCADCVARQRHPLQQTLGRALHQVLVDVGAGVALVAVGDDELLLALRRACEAPLDAGREPGAAAPADLRRLDLLQQRLGRDALVEHAPQARPVARPRQHRLGERRLPRRLARRDAGAGQSPLHDARPRVDHVAVAHRGRAVAEAEADGLRQRDGAVLRPLTQPDPERRAQRVHVRVARRCEARGAGADAHMAHAARLQQVVVEGRDAVDRGLRQAGARRCLAPVRVGHLAAQLDGLLEHVERGRRVERVVAADQLDEVPRHVSRRSPTSCAPAARSPAR